MNMLEFIVVLTAGPIIAALVYGSWKFHTDEESAAPTAAKPSSRPSSKSLGRMGRHSNLKRALSA